MLDLPRPTPACEATRGLVSARRDDPAAPAIVGDDLDHLVSCDPCSQFARGIAPGATLGALVATARSEAPDRTASLLAAITNDAAAAVVDRLQQVRWLLGVAGTLMLVLALPGVLGLQEIAIGEVLLADLGMHAARDAAVFQMALGAGFVLTARDPERAVGLLPVVAMVAALSLVTGVADLVNGNATFAQEMTHVLEFVGFGLVWSIARELPRRATLAIA